MLLCDGKIKKCYPEQLSELTLRRSLKHDFMTVRIVRLIFSEPIKLIDFLMQPDINNYLNYVKNKYKIAKRDNF